MLGWERDRLGCVLGRAVIRTCLKLCFPAVLGDGFAINAYAAGLYSRIDAERKTCAMVACGSQVGVPRVGYCLGRMAEGGCRVEITKCQRSAVLLVKY